MTNREMRLLAASMDLRGIREACGFSQRRIGRALNASQWLVRGYENGKRTPNGELGARYLRIMTGLRNHLEADGGLERAA